MGSILTLFLDIIRLAARLIRPGGMTRVVAEHLILRQQLILLQRKRKRAPRLLTFDRMVFAISSLFIRTSRLPALSVVIAHSSVLALHRALVNRKYSLLFSNQRPKKPGPKGPSPELIKLVVEIKTNNPRYGCPKIALLVSKLLGDDISEQTIRRILRKHFRPTPGSEPSWLNAIGTAKDVLWSMDLFCVESIRLQTHWVMLVMDHHTREIIGFAVHAGALTGEDVCQMFHSIRCQSGRCPRYLSTYNDPLFRFHRWRANLRIFEIDEIKSIPESPWSHPFVERAIGTVRRESLDDTLFWNARGLEKVLNQYAHYYNEARVHSSISGHTPRGFSGDGAIAKIDLKNFAWKSYCGGRFSIPVAA
jgi:putative transposase